MNPSTHNSNSTGQEGASSSRDAGRQRSHTRRHRHRPRGDPFAAGAAEVDLFQFKQGEERQTSAGAPAAALPPARDDDPRHGAGRNAWEPRRVEEEDEQQRHRRRRRRHRRGDDGKPRGREERSPHVVVVADDDDDDDDSGGDSSSGGDSDDRGYDPANKDALDEKARLLGEELHALEEGGQPSGGLTRPPSEFEAAPIPYWVQRLSDLLLLHNAVRGGCRADMLPVDAAAGQLLADLAEARALLREVETGGDWGIFRTRTARAYEVYGGAGDDEADRADAAHEMEPMLRQDDGPADAGDTVEVHITGVEGGGDDSNSDDDGDDGNDNKTGSAEGAGRARRPVAAAPLLPPEEEARDEQLPIMQRAIPLWRRRGAAKKSLTELIALLESRLRLLNRKLADPISGPWYEAVGAPNCTGVDGTQRVAPPPALEQAYAAFMANAILSDLFIPATHGGLRDRAVRISEALLPQTPKVHADFLIEDDFRPMYDGLASKRAQMIDLPGSSTVPGADAEERRSFAVHLDYVRLHPSQSPSLHLLHAGEKAGPAGDDAFSRLLNGTQYHASLLSGDMLEDTLLMTGIMSEQLGGDPLHDLGWEGGEGSLSTDATAAAAEAAARQRRRRAPAGTGPEALRFSAAASATLSMLSVAASQGQPLVPFTPESFLVALVLQHYERYRLLCLNLLPYLKSRGFYAEQLAHLAQQREPTADLALLQTQLQALHDRAAALERASITAMIALWRAVLQLRGQSAEEGNGDSAVPFFAASRRAARAAAAASAQQQQQRSPSPSTAAAGGGGALTADREPTPGRRNVGAVDIFAADDADAPPDGGDLNALTATATEPLFFTTSPGQTLRGASSGGAAMAATTTRNRPRASSSIILGSGSSSSASINVDGTSAHGGSSTVRQQQQEGGEGAEGGGTMVVRSARRAPRLRLFLRRVGHLTETPYIAGDDVLLYEPVVEGADALPERPRPQQQPQLLPNPSPADDDERRVEELLFFQVAVFARASAALAPQYVGCTMPRPLSAANVIFFNESFEVRVLNEPVEIIMHIIAIAPDQDAGSVVATVRLRPTLTRGYLLLPLLAPVSFVFKKRLLARCSGAGVTGVLSASTTWTTPRGLTITQIERLFTSGAADPLNPEYAPLMRMLQSYYREVGRNEREQRARSRGTAGTTAPGAAGGGKAPEAAPGRGAQPTAEPTTLATALRTGSRYEGPAGGGGGGAGQQQQQRQRRPFTLAMLREIPLLGVSGAAAAAAGGGGGGGALGPAAVSSSSLSLVTAAPAGSRRLSERLLLMRHRWLIQKGLSKAVDQVEATLLRRPIPIYEAEQYDLLKQVRRTLAREENERKKARNAFLALDGGGGGSGADAGDGAGGQLDLFDEKAYHAEPSSVSGLALSPLPREVKLKLWQDRQRHIKLTRRPTRHVSDEERLGQLVTIPKFSLQLVFDTAPRSQFNPRREVRPKTEDIDRELLNRRRDSRIVVHVMKAGNLPERADGTPLEPFVQVSFVCENAYSRCEVGSSPSWFQSLELPFQPLDFDEETLSMIDDDIVLSVYDKVEIPMRPATITTGAVAHETHYRTERRLLGTLRLPFYSLHQAAEARMEGVYPLFTPRWLLGYDAAATTHSQGAQNPFGEDPTAAAASDRSAGAGPTIQLYVSLWPPLQREKASVMSLSEVSSLVRQLNVPLELHYLHEAALKWQKSATSRIKAITQMNAQATARQVEPFVNCSTGDLVLACRYLLPHGGPPPPKTVTNIYEAIRYVSLLPFVVDIMTWGDKDVWSTNVELLALRSGDYEELALLLAHFLRHLAPNTATYVVVGEGEVYAQTIMVLHAFEGNQWRLIDPRSGWVAPVERPFGTILRDVHYVISHDQMWANVQITGLPHRMSWELDDTAYWLPCFDARKDRRITQCMPALTAIQREVLTFSPVDPAKAKEIEVDLRAALKKSLLAWRNHRQPAYHRGVEAILRDLLVAAEEERCACGSVRHPEVTALARERLAEYFGVDIDGVHLADPRRGQRRGRGSRSRSRARKGNSGSVVVVEPAATGSDNDDDDDENENDTVARAPPPPRSTGGLRRLRQCLRLVGAPVTSSYSPEDRRYYKILQQVFESATHEVGTDEVSFAAGVYVKGYTGDVYAMWVFLVAVCRGVEEVADSDGDGDAAGGREVTSKKREGRKTSERARRGEHREDK